MFIAWCINCTWPQGILLAIQAIRFTFVFHKQKKVRQRLQYRFLFGRVGGAWRASTRVSLKRKNNRTTYYVSEINFYTSCTLVRYMLHLRSPLWSRVFDCCYDRVTCVIKIVTCHVLLRQSHVTSTNCSQHCDSKPNRSYNKRSLRVDSDCM